MLTRCGQFRRALYLWASSVIFGTILGLGCTTNVEPEPEPPGPGNSGVTGKYIGSERCAQCHSNVHSGWAGTLHATALETLEEIGQGSNADCLGCHTVGFGEDGGFVDRATTNVLAGVGCESCHGPAADHVNNVNDESLRPKIDLAADVCGKCHQGEHHPNSEDWHQSMHANSIEPSQITDWSNGTSGKLTNCGKCHSGDYFYHAIIKGESVGDDLLQGKTGPEMLRITCAICHNPHQRTGNASTPEDGRDYQLRFPQIKFTTPTSDLAAVQDPSRFNICGQCHHARSSVWTDTSREPHPSDQANVFFGEMPVPANKPDPIVPFRNSVHLNTPDQCSTCHVARKPFEAGIAPAVSGHTFEVNFLGCVQCHGSTEVAEARLANLEAEMQLRMDEVQAALDDWEARNTGPNELCSNLAHTGSCWEYTNEGGPNSSGQAYIPDDIKKARYIWYYVRAGGGNGAHNPDYVREALILAKEYAENTP